MTVPSGRDLYEPLFTDVRDQLRKKAPDFETSVSLEDKRLRVKHPRAAWSHIEVSVASDQRVARRFFVSVVLQSSGPDVAQIVRSIRQSLGAVQEYSGPFSTEVRRW